MNTLFKDVLIVSQNEHDVNLLKSGFLDLSLSKDTLISSSIEESIKLLEERKLSKNIPEIMVLDIDQIDVETNPLIQKIRSDSELKSMILIVLSENTQKIFDSFQINSAGVITKPFEKESLDETLGKFKNYWRLNVRPRHSL